jgi:hypothetical protein
MSSVWRMNFNLKEEEEWELTDQQSTLRVHGFLNASQHLQSIFI